MSGGDTRRGVCLRQSVKDATWLRAEPVHQEIMSIDWQLAGEVDAFTPN